MQRDFEGGVYWDDLPESAVRFRGNMVCIIIYHMMQFIITCMHVGIQP